MFPILWRKSALMWHMDLKKRINATGQVETAADFKLLKYLGYLHLGSLQQHG